MNTLDAMYQAIIDSPADDTVRLVYADALDEAGGVENTARAEFIRVQCELRHKPICPDWCARDPANCRTTWLEDRGRSLLDANPGWLTKPCEACGGDGFYKGPRLGDERCPACLGNGNMLTRFVTAIEGEPGGGMRAVPTWESRCPRFARGFIDSATCFLSEFDRLPSVTCPAYTELSSARNLHTHTGGTGCPYCDGGGEVLMFPEDGWPATMLRLFPLSRFRLLVGTPSSSPTVFASPGRTVSGGGVWRTEDDSGSLFARADILPDWLFRCVGRHHDSPQAALDKLETTLCRLVRISIARHKRMRELMAAP